MSVKYCKTRYAAREQWEKHQFDDETRRKINEGLLVGLRYKRPPGPASEDVAESLDLSHFDFTTIFSSIETGWHFEKSISYDAMMSRSREKKRERAEMKQIKNPGRARKSNYYLEDRKRREREARDRRMAEGRAFSDDEDALDVDLKERNRRNKALREQRCEVVSSANLPLIGVTTVVVRDVGIASGPIPMRPDVKGERLRLFTRKEDKERMDSDMMHMTDLLGFGHSKFACFFMSGEPYIVVPQMLAALHLGYGHDPKRFGCLMEKLDTLKGMKTANGKQVRTLKTHKMINGSLLNGKELAIRLMKKSDASRLLGEYLPLEEDENANMKISRISAEQEEEAVMVEHECQGSAKGILYKNGYIRCDECTRIFKPDSFVCHSHRRTETQGVVHWGFNPRRWRDYLNLYGKDRKDPEKIKRFNFIISEPIPVEIKSMKKEGRPDYSVYVPLNRGFNRRPPSPFEVGAESTGRLPQPRKTDEDEEVEEEETVEVTPEQKTIEVIDDEIQIIEPPPTSKSFRKEESLFKAPDLFATPLSRKYTEQAFKTKGFDLEGLLPVKLHDPFPLQNTLATLHQSLLLQQPQAVFAAAAARTEFNPLKAFLDLFPTEKGCKSDEDSFDKPVKTEKSTDTPSPSELPPLPDSTTAVVPYLKDQHSLVSTSTNSAFIPVHPLTKYYQDVARYQKREQMARQLDDKLMGLLQQVPVSLASQIAEVVKNRDELRDENNVETKNRLISSTALCNQLANHCHSASKETEFLYQVIRDNDVEVPKMPRDPPPQQMAQPAAFPPSINTFPAFPQSSQPLSILPPASSAPPPSSRPFQLNGGRSHSLSLPSPIGIRTVPSSMLGQPGPASTSMAGSASSAAARPMQPPQRVVGQRGRPRGSGGSGYQRKNSVNHGHAAVAAASHAAEVANIQRQIEQQKQHQQIQMQLRALQQLQQQQHQQQQQLQQQQQQQQQAFALAQSSPLAMLNSGSLSGSSSSSNLLSSLGLSSSSTPVSLSSLLSASLPSTPQPMQQLQQSQNDFSGMSGADAAAIMARVQLDSTPSVGSCSTPLSNGLQLPSTPTQDSLQSILSLTPEHLQTLLLQETQRQQQLQPSPSPSTSAPLVQQTSPVAAPAAPAALSVVSINGGLPVVDLDTLRNLIANPSTLPVGVSVDTIRAWHDSLATAAGNQLQS